MQNAAGGDQPSLPGMDAAPNAALTIKAYLSNKSIPFPGRQRLPELSL